MRLFSIICLLAFSSTFSFAQKAMPVFLEDLMVNWFEKEVKNYDTALAYLNSADFPVTEQEKRAYHKQKKQAKRSLRRFNSNGMLIYKRLESQMDEANNKTMKNHYGDDMHISEYERKVNSFRNAKNQVEFKMKQQDLDAYLDNLAAIKSVYDELLGTENYWPTTASKRSSNLEKLNKVQTIASSNLELLSRSKVN